MLWRRAPLLYDNYRQEHHRQHSYLAYIDQMEDKTRNTVTYSAEENTEKATASSLGSSRVTRHTWIGDKDEVRVDQSRPVTRATYADINSRTTRVVERQRKPYQGFITDEEVQEAQKTADEIKKTRVMREAAARKALAETRIYEGLGSGLDREDIAGDAGQRSGEKEIQGEQKTTGKKIKDQAESKPPREKKYITIDTSSSAKRKMIISAGAVFAALLIFLISFAVMKSKVASLPGRTQELQQQTIELQAENEKLQQQADETGDIDQMRDNKDSWERIKETLTE